MSEHPKTGVPPCKLCGLHPVTNDSGTIVRCSYYLCSICDT